MPYKTPEVVRARRTDKLIELNSHLTCVPRYSFLFLAFCCLHSLSKKYVILASYKHSRAFCLSHRQVVHGHVTSGLVCNLNAVGCADCCVAAAAGSSLLSNYSAALY